LISKSSTKTYFLISRITSNSSWTLR
jgi:hypothetical protein